MAFFTNIAKQVGAVSRNIGNLFGAISDSLGRIFRSRGKPIEPPPGLFSDLTEIVSQSGPMLGESYPEYARRVRLEQIYEQQDREVVFIPVGNGIQGEPEEGALDDVMFIFFQQDYTDFESSNVFSFLYSRQDQKLTVGYKGRRGPAEIGYYEYRPISEEEARDAWRAISKGGWVWDKLRVRGTKCGHRKDYVFLSAPSSWHPRLGCNVWGTSRKQGKFP